MPKRPRKPEKKTPHKRRPAQRRQPEKNVLGLMSLAQLPPEWAHAYKKTGVVGFGADRQKLTKEQIARWDAAVQDFRLQQALEARKRNGDAPIPKEWNTNIPDLVASGFDQSDYEKVIECIDALGTVETKGMKVAARIELAAAVLASVCESGFDSGVLNVDDGAKGFAWVEEMVVRRARELYAQGQS